MAEFWFENPNLNSSSVCGNRKFPAAVTNVLISCFFLLMGNGYECVCVCVCVCVCACVCVCVCMCVCVCVCEEEETVRERERVGGGFVVRKARQCSSSFIFQQPLSQETLKGGSTVSYVTPVDTDPPDLHPPPPPFPTSHFSKPPRAASRGKGVGEGGGQ